MEAANVTNIFISSQVTNDIVKDQVERRKNITTLIKLETCKDKSSPLFIETCLINSVTLLIKCNWILIQHQEIRSKFKHLPGF